MSGLPSPLQCVILNGCATLSIAKQLSAFKPFSIASEVIYNKDTNRAILRNLMENGLRDATGQLPGKSIIFARNHQHAVLMRQMFDDYKFGRFDARRRRTA